MEWIIIVKNILEALYYVAGIILVIGIIIGYQQLALVKEQITLLKNEAKQAKLDFQVSNQRASIGKSIEYLNWFAVDFIPQMDDYLRELKGKDILKFKDLHGKKFVFDQELSSTDTTVRQSIALKNSAGISSLANQLEFFSAAMTSGLADEDLAFNPLASVFCDFVEGGYDFYCQIRDGGNEIKYTKTIELYEMWSQRKKKMEFDKQQQELDEKKSKVKDTRIKYIGSQ